jgi:hypothetical protein
MQTQNVVFDVPPLERWSPAQVWLRLAVVFGLGLVHTSISWLFYGLYLGLPVAAAVCIQRDGVAEYPNRGGQTVLRILHIWNAVIAYLLFLTDRFPTDPSDLVEVRFEVNPAGQVSVAQALLRLLTSIPEFLVIALLGPVAALLGVVAGASVLFTGRVPALTLRFLRVYVALQARWSVYHCSLVDVHPLFHFSSEWQPR